MSALSVLIVNTQSRALLLRCLDSVQRELVANPRWSDAQVVVLDNASTDGSAAAARAHPLVPEVLAKVQRQGKATSDSELLRHARAPYGLLLNEDAELLPGALDALAAALDADPRAAAAGARLTRPDGTVQPSAWRFPSVPVALAQATFQHARFVVQSSGTATRPVDWAQSAALLVRVEAAREIGYFDEAFFVYSDEVDFAKRLSDAGWHSLWVPGATVVHHEQLSTDSAADRRIVEFARGRDRYLRKHTSPPARLVILALTAWTYLLRAAAALVLPGHDPQRYLAHVRATLDPARGEGLSDAASAFNASLN